MNQAATQTFAPVRHFTVLLSATRRGARLARLLTERQLADWGQPSGAAEQVVAELAANAVLHGLVPGRDFRLALGLDGIGTLRIAVTDARGDRLPRVQAPAGDGAESGRGLLLVAAYADRWGVTDGPGPACKTVWAELAPDRSTRQLLSPVGQVDPHWEPDVGRVWGAGKRRRIGGAGGGVVAGADPAGESGRVRRPGP